MGGGKKTSQNNVPKKPRSYSTDTGAVGVGGGGGVDASSSNTCLVSFKAKLNLDGSVGTGTKFVLIMSDDSDGLEVVSGGRNIGDYTGSKLSMLKKCMTGGYRYDGTVDKIVGSSAECTIAGSGPT